MAAGAAGSRRNGVPAGRGAAGAVRDTGAAAEERAVITGRLEPTSGAAGTGPGRSTDGVSADTLVTGGAPCAGAR
ncbi:hypothetical protein [Streptomyces sp. NPDC059092]|uniref:hypothetical protein n=1 Tax=Streptomyces sp. NPDC059092 TaxID=3346725 RepID=UPI00369453DF